MPTGKMWTSFAVAAGRHPIDIEDEKDVRHHIRMFMEQPYTHLGHSRIDGIEVEGIETRDLPYKDEAWSDGAARLWAEVRTGLPIRMEFTGVAENKRFRFLYDIRWEEDLDRIRKLLPAFKGWSRGRIRDACNMDGEAAVATVLEIGEPEQFHETEKGIYYRGRVIFVGRDRKTRVQDMLVLLRAGEEKIVVLVYGALGGPRVIEDTTEH